MALLKAEQIETNVIAAMKIQFEPMETKDCEISGLKNEVKSSNARIYKLADTSDYVDAMSKRNQVVLSGKDLPIENSRPERRNILVSLENSETKINLLKTYKNVKPSFIANENLTPCRNTILYVLRKMKKTSPYCG